MSTAPGSRSGSGRRPAPATRRRIALAGLVIVAVVLAAGPRLARSLRHEWSTATSWPGGLPAGASADGFFSVDPDGLYHMRRVLRALEHTGDGPRIAPEDPYLDAPHGSAIPWPPYYDLALWLAATPFAPRVDSAADEAPDAAPGAARAAERDAVLALRRRFVEHWVASAPFALGLAAAGLVALAAWRLGGAVAALAAGAQFALTRGSYNYAQLGLGDHHAWTALLALLLWLELATGFGRGALARPRAGLACGALAGALAGLLLGSWVASLVHVVVVDALLGGLLVARAWRTRSRAELDGLPALGLAFHAVALAVLLPAVLDSPWKDVDPWMTVNLSWFHASYLALGLLVFAPLALAASAPGSRPFAAGSRSARVHVVACGLALAALGVLGAAGSGPASGLADAFAWASRENAFMDVVRESRPLFGDGRGATLFIEALGLAGFAAPLAWLFGVRVALRERRLELLPWLVAFPVLFVQALGQVRFTNALAAPLAVWIGFGCAAVVARLGWRATLWAPLVLALIAVGHYPAFAAGSPLRVGFDPPARFWGPPVQDHVLGERMLYEWLREQGGTAPVLAHWDDGHAIEWVADRPSVATNFGSYVGAESYADPPRCFLARDEQDAYAVLDRRGARHVVLTRDVWINVITMVRALGQPLSDWFQQGDIARGFTPRIFDTVLARLVPVVVARDADSERATTTAFEELRLVHVSPSFDLRRQDPRSGTPLRAGWIWERVPGALVEARGAAGERLELALVLDYPRSSYALEVALAAPVGADGVARLRVPYATLAPNGDGIARGPWRFQIGARAGELHVPAKAVLNGAQLDLDTASAPPRERR